MHLDAGTCGYGELTFFFEVNTSLAISGFYRRGMAHVRVNLLGVDYLSIWADNSEFCRSLASVHVESVLVLNSGNKISGDFRFSFNRARHQYIGNLETVFGFDDCR